jgi:hypothetical protein
LDMTTWVKSSLIAQDNIKLTIVQQYHFVTRFVALCFRLAQ